jgi:hypothetical protein
LADHRGDLKTEIECRISGEHARSVFLPDQGKQIDDSLRLIRRDAQGLRWMALALLY